MSLWLITQLPNSTNLPTKVQVQVGAHSSCNTIQRNMDDMVQLPAMEKHMDCNNMGQRTKTADPKNDGIRYCDCGELCRDEA